MLVAHPKYSATSGLSAVNGMVFRFVFDTDDIQLIHAEVVREEGAAPGAVSADEFGQLQTHLEAVEFDKKWQELGAHDVMVPCVALRPPEGNKVTSLFYELGPYIRRKDCYAQEGDADLFVDASGKVWADTGLTESELPDMEEG